MSLPIVKEGAPRLGDRDVLRYLAILRPVEILILQGPPLLGMLIAVSVPQPSHLGRFLVLLAANVCLVAHIFVLNDWSNLTDDRADPKKLAGIFTSKGVQPAEVKLMAAGLLALSVGLFTLLGVVPVVTALAIALASALYSLPRLNWKSRPLLNSGIHLIGGLLHFLLGYSVSRAYDLRGILIGAFFAVTFAAGHLTQEIRDHEGDARSGATTNAVVFGPRRTFGASVVLFTLSHGLLFSLALAEVLPRVLTWLALLYPLHLRWSLQTLNAGLTRDGVCALQARYRLLYAFTGAAIVASLWLG
jgi:4-hydroxybenzoate polyprenyltransferase